MNYLRTLWIMTLSSTKMYFRNFTAVFFTFVFPVIFLLVFGFINSSDQLRLDVAYFNDRQSPAATALDDAFKQLVVDEANPEAEGRIFELDNSNDVEAAKTKLAAGDINAVIVVPEDFSSDKGNLTVYVDATNQTINGILDSVIGGLLEPFNVAANVEAVGQPPLKPFSVQTETVQSDEIDAISYLVPGIIAFSILSLGVFSITQGFIELKTNGALRRLQVTPIKPFSFLFAESMTRLLMTLINVWTMVLIGTLLFGFTIQGNFIYFSIVAILGIILFLGFGFAIAGWAKNADQAAPISNIIFFPMMFLSGTFFPREFFPDWLKPVTDFMPLTYVADALREVANNAASLFDLGPELLGISVWIVLIYSLTIKIFRWE